MIFDYALPAIVTAAGVLWGGEMISLMMKHPNVYVDTSGYKWSRCPRDLVDYMRGPGKRKVLFGRSGKELARCRTLRLGPFPAPPHQNCS